MRRSGTCWQMRLTHRRNRENGGINMSIEIDKYNKDFWIKNKVEVKTNED